MEEEEVSDGGRRERCGEEPKLSNQTIRAWLCGGGVACQEGDGV